MRQRNGTCCGACGRYRTARQLAAASEWHSLAALSGPLGVNAAFQEFCGSEACHSNGETACEGIALASLRPRNNAQQDTVECLQGLLSHLCDAAVDSLRFKSTKSLIECGRCTLENDDRVGAFNGLDVVTLAIPESPEPVLISECLEFTLSKEFAVHRNGCLGCDSPLEVDGVPSLRAGKFAIIQMLRFEGTGVERRKNTASVVVDEFLTIGGEHYEAELILEHQGLNVAGHIVTHRKHNGRNYVYDDGSLVRLDSVEM